MIDARERAILEILVREYIKTAEPVSSSRVEHRMKNTLSPASVRNVFSDLTDAGFIEQPHTSGGRVPKTRAYRFFVDQLIESGAQANDLPYELEHMMRHADEGIGTLRNVQEELARHLHVVSCFGSMMPRGFDEMFSEPEFTEEPFLAREIGKFLDEFENFRQEYNETLEPNSFDIMIGEENGIQPMRHMSVIVGKNEDEDLFFIAGPMRMPYDHIISMMNIWKKKPTNTNKKI